MRLIGLDLGGTAVKAGALDADGARRVTRSAPVDLSGGPGPVLELLASLARELGVEQHVGIGVPGLVDAARGCVLESPNLAPMREVPIKHELARLLGIPDSGVALANDANAAALGEHWLGTGQSERDFLLVTLGTGVGGGLILDGRLYAGGGGMAGEIGHVVVDPNGRKCGCGGHGCLETLASATAAKRRAHELGLSEDLIELARIARERDGAERALFHAIGRDLGRGLAMAVSLLDLRCFLIGGGFSAALDLMLPGVRVGLHERSYGARIDNVRVARAGLGADAGWIGAARLLLPDPH